MKKYETHASETTPAASSHDDAKDSQGHYQQTERGFDATCRDLRLVCRCVTRADSWGLGLAAAISAGKLSGCLAFKAACMYNSSVLTCLAHVAGASAVIIRDAVAGCRVLLTISQLSTMTARLPGDFLHTFSHQMSAHGTACRARHCNSTA